MFKKLKQKINEEQSPQRNALSPPQQQQAQVGPGERRSSHTPSLHQDAPASPSDRESGSKGVMRSPRGSINGDGSASPQREEPQSFAQKLQLKVPSVESLLRGASRAEGLFRSPSKDSLVRSSSRDSLTALGESDSPTTPAYDPPSDIESEAEESPSHADSLSKDQLLRRLHRVEKSLGNYRGKYSELVIAYRTVQRDKEKTQAILSQSQDKSLRRIGELREELQMDQQAKKHLQEEFDSTLEEKDQKITVLQTQVALMKKRLKGVPGGVGLPEGDVPQSEEAVGSSSAPQSPSKEPGADTSINEEGSSDPEKVAELLQQRVKRQENLLQKCKELLRTHKERSAQLGSENETLQQQLQERLQELEKIKELHTAEKTRLITQLRDAKNLIEQLEQDKGMVIAETKRQMHETLEMKEEEIAQLRSRIKEAAVQREELQEQKEKSEKSAFEELERALGVAQRAEEARRQLQVQLEEQVKEVEKASEEERKSLQQELTRVKQEVVTIMKKSSEDKVAEMDRLHSEALTSKEAELSGRISQAVEQCKEEFAEAAKEREQQAALALEDAELQKAAELQSLETVAENSAKEIRLELETARTRILELESSLEKNSEAGSDEQSDELSHQLEAMQTTHNQEMTAREETHREQLEKHKQKQDVLAQQHNTAMEELKKKHRVKVETVLQEREQQFHAHVEDMNQKTVEKLDVKQTELEALSSELSEVLKWKQILEVKLAAAEDAAGLVRQELEQKLQHELTKHSGEIEEIRSQHEQSLGGMEKTLKEELNKLKMVLKEKESELAEHSLREKSVEEESETVLQEMNAKVKELEVLRDSLLQAQSEKEGLEQSNAHLSRIRDELSQCKSEFKDLERQLQQAKKDLSEQEESYTKELKTKQEEEKQLNKQLDDLKATQDRKIENTKKEMEGKLKSQETKMDKIKHKAKEMQEKFKKRLQEQEESMKNELAKKEKELQEKGRQVKEMARTSSEGLSSTLSELKANHKEELEKLREVCKQEQEELECRWKEKLERQEEDTQEKHYHMLQQKAQQVEELFQHLGTTREEKEHVLQEVKNLREELAMRETTVHKLQAELKEAAVKLESLSQAEAILKEQVEAVEKNLSQALNERNSFQDRLSNVEDESRAKLKAQTDTFEEREKKLQIAIRNQMRGYCQAIQAKMEGGTKELRERVEGRVRELKDRVSCNQIKVAHLKNVILTKVDRVRTIEKQLLQRSEENQNLCNSQEQMISQLDVYTENIKALTAEKESLQRDAESQYQALSEKVICIEKLSEDNKTISENVQTNALHISNLESIINDLKTQLASSLTGKSEAISLLHQQHKEERERLVCQMQETIEGLDKEKKSAVEQADTLRNNLSEFKRKAESKFTQNHNTLKSLQTRFEDMERQVADKDEALQSLTTSVDNQSVSKSEMDQSLSEKVQKISALTLEVERCKVRVVELEEQLSLKTNECQQLITDLKQQHNIMDSEKRELTERLQQTNEQFTQNGNLVQETEEKLQSLEKENQTSKQELVRQREDFEKINAGILKSKEDSLRAAEERMSAESAGKVAELKKKAEQKIVLIRKQLTSHLEEKDQTINAIQTQLGEMKESEARMKQHMETLEEKGKTLEEVVAKEKHLEQVRNDERLEKESSLESLKNMYEERLASLQRELSNQEETKAGEVLSSLLEVEKKLKETEEQNENHLAEISSLKVDLLEKTALVVEQNTAIASFDKQRQSPVNLENAIEMEQCTAEQTKSNIGKEMENQSLKEEEMDIESSMSLQNKLKEAVNEKQKLQKDFTRLQKDLRSLRKEHEQDLDYMKKELTGENEKKLTLELEDMEMKHNSGLKQLMREFNTQMALKEQELEAVIKETIGKAQSVEVELMTSHREEANQLQKVIAQKDDDLNRTVRRYEEVLQSREDEMGDRVWQVQKELEDLQTRSLVSTSNSQVGVEELQLQLAERTTLLSEAKLKEQEFVDRIHALEDKIRSINKHSVVTHLGSTFKDPGHFSADAFSEPTELEYLRKVLFEYMMGRETKTMAKVITSMLKFPPDQAEKVLEKEDSKAAPWLR